MPLTDGMEIEGVDVIPTPQWLLLLPEAQNLFTG